MADDLVTVATQMFEHRLQRPRGRVARRSVAALGSVAALLASGLVATSAGDLQDQINASQSTAKSLQSQIQAESQQIADTGNGIAAARAQLAGLQATLYSRIAELRTVQTELLDARDHLIALENRLGLASAALAANVRAAYEQGEPDLMSVILSAHGFSQLLEQVDFMQRIGHQDASIVHNTRAARAEVVRQTIRLGTLEERAAAQARQTALEVNQSVGGIAIDPSGMVQPPADAPAAVRQMIAAGNAIATLPYIWGGGHASFSAAGYDCSGSVSYVLAAAGLLTAPEVSGDFESYGAPGPGQWVTIYANAGHVWMTIAGWRFDTVALAEGGTRWSQGGGEYDGFVVRHPIGL